MNQFSFIVNQISTTDQNLIRKAARTSQVKEIKPMLFYAPQIQTVEEKGVMDGGWLYRAHIEDRNR